MCVSKAISFYVLFSGLKPRQRTFFLPLKLENVPPFLVFITYGYVLPVGAAFFGHFNESHHFYSGAKVVTLRNATSFDYL